MDDRARDGGGHGDGEEEEVMKMGKTEEEEGMVKAEVWATASDLVVIKAWKSVETGCLFGRTTKKGKRRHPRPDS